MTMEFMVVHVALHFPLQGKLLTTVSRLLKAASLVSVEDHKHKKTKRQESSASIKGKRLRHGSSTPAQTCRCKRQRKC